MKTHLNLLPQQFRNRLLVRTRLRQWSIVWAVCFVTTVGVCYLKNLQLDTARRTLDVREKKCLPLRATLAGNKRVQEQLTQLHARQHLLAHLDRVQHPLPLVGLVSRSARFGDGRLKVQHFSFTQLREPSTDSREKNDNLDDLNHLLLKGIAVDDLAVARFIVALRDNGVFDSVDLKSSIGTQTPEGKVREYLLECTF